MFAEAIVMNGFSEPGAVSAIDTFSASIEGNIRDCWYRLWIRNLLKYRFDAVNGRYRAFTICFLVFLMVMPRRR
jgi:hypothetical protein